MFVHDNTTTVPTHRVHLHACAKVGQFEVSVLVQQHVVGFHIAVDEAHGVDGVQGQHHLGCVEASPLLRHVVVHGECDQVSSGHELHHQVEVTVVLESTAQLGDSKQSHSTAGSCVTEQQKH